MSVIITRAKPFEAESIYELEKICFDPPWTSARIVSRIMSQDCEFLTAIDGDNTILGYVSMERVLDEGYIGNIAVSPKHRRRGVGGALLAELHKLGAQGLSFITLEVRAGNLAAIGLYEKCGYRAAGRRPKYYTNPPEDAILMTLHFEDKTVC